MIELHCRITPNAKHDALGGWEEDAQGRRVLWIKLQAPPVEGKANRRLIRFLAEMAGVPRSAVSLLQGDKSRVKRLSITGLSQGEWDAVLKRHLDGG